MQHKYSISEKLKKFDSELEYLGGYVDCNSIVKCYCNRCKNTFSRKWSNLVKHKKECRCPICQNIIALNKTKESINKRALDNLKERETNFINNLKQLRPDIKYISGFKNNDSIVLIEFNNCKHEHNISVDRLLRKNKSVVCQKCLKEEYNHKKELELEITRINKLKEKEKLEAERFNRGNQLTITIKECKECGCLFFDNNSSKYCSSKCKNRSRGRKHDKKRLERAKQNGLVDNSITLLKLIKRDNGICYICGNKVNLEDYITKDNNVICGNYYPSIDHVIPLSKGGTHSWSNIKLAHRICNSLKGNQTLPHC